MRLISAFLKILSLDTKPAPEPIAPPEPSAGAVKAEHLLALAIVMRDLWMADAGFAGEGHRARSMVLAALLRLFPDRAETAIAECLQRRCAGYCDDCPAPSACASMRQLDQYLEGIEFPTLTLPVTQSTVEAVRAALLEHERQLRLDEAREQALT